jgi:uncharacterized protein YcaQ
VQLSQAQARAVHLAAQGILDPPDLAATKADVLAAIRRMHLLQIDTIHIVARSPYLVLWSRLGSYEPHWLDELLAEGALFEYWAHAACFLPIEDYGLYRWFMLHGAWARRWQSWIAERLDETARVLDYIRDNGPTMARDFQRTDRRKSVWWDWKPEKLALECLFYTGKLMIVRRDNFQRVYDLRERVLPGWDDSQVPTEKQVRKTLVARTVQALGVVPGRWVPGYFYMGKTGVPALLKDLVEEKQLIELKVEGWPEPGYVHADNLPLIEQAQDGKLTPNVTTLLSPFDPVASDRDRLEGLFGFNYRIETYTPSDRRRFGYFTLPILHRGAIVGRLDPKAHRREGIFEIKALHLEPGVKPTKQMASALASAFQHCATWHETPNVVIRQSDPPELAQLVQAALTKMAPRQLDRAMEA